MVDLPFWQGKKASNPRPTVLETAALPAELFPCILLNERRFDHLKWWTVRDSNPGPTGYEPAALPTELTVHLYRLLLSEGKKASNPRPIVKTPPFCDVYQYCRHDIVAAIPFVGAPCRIRTYDPAVNSRMLYLLS